VTGNNRAVLLSSHLSWSIKRNLLITKWPWFYWRTSTSSFLQHVSSWKQRDIISSRILPGDQVTLILTLF